MTIYFHIAYFFTDESNGDKIELYHFCYLAPLLLRGLTWVKLCEWTQKPP